MSASEITTGQCACGQSFMVIAGVPSDGLCMTCSADADRAKRAELKAARTLRQEMRRAMRGLETGGRKR